MVDQTSAEALNDPLPQTHDTTPISPLLITKTAPVLLDTSNITPKVLILSSSFFSINHRSGSCLMLLHI